MFMRMSRECLKLRPLLTERQSNGWTEEQEQRITDGRADWQSVRGASTNRETRQQSHKWLGGWMDGELSEECGNDGSTDGCERRWINAANERQMEFNDRMQWHTNTLTDSIHTGAPKMQLFHHSTYSDCWLKKCC